ncbi:hypothetical protein V5O48_018992 [Marasmius crinis-equi]|uniref:Uncharacterized protein n=1 Tax=Marasmius crinis-equi TaxID=585013 RepID=A0ABR3EJM1_9AGAR
MAPRGSKTKSSDPSPRNTRARAGRGAKSGVNTNLPGIPEATAEPVDPVDEPIVGKSKGKKAGKAEVAAVLDSSDPYDNAMEAAESGLDIQAVKTKKQSSKKQEDTRGA